MTSRILEDHGAVSECLVAASKGGGFGQVRVLHRGFVRVEERQNEVVARIVVILCDDRSAKGPFTLGSRAPLLVDLLKLTNL